MFYGMPVPNSAVARAHVVAQTIQIHMTWEIDNLKHSVNPSAGVNSFVEFVTVLFPQIQGLAVGEFAGEEDTPQVRAEISSTALKLLCWTVEQVVILARAVTPQYQSYQAATWSAESAKTLWDIDSALKKAYYHQLHSFPESKQMPPEVRVPGLFSPRIMRWAFTQLTWLNKMASGLQQKVDMITNPYGDRVELFTMTREALKTYIRQAQHNQGLAGQVVAGIGSVGPSTDR
jgi:hypothetical protein